MSINAALESVPGPYLWGERDCQHTLAAVALAVRGEPLDLAATEYAEYARLTHENAVARAVREHGRVGALYERALGARPEIFERLPGPRDAGPGDIAVVEGPAVEIAGEVRDTAETGSMLAFMDEACRWLAWAPHGLAEFGGEFRLESVWRCRAR